LQVSAQPSSKVEDPRSHRKLLVLDLNGTLVYRGPHQRRNVYQQPPNVPRPLRTVHPRPYLASFRDYLFHPRTKEWLDTMVWSSAQPHSVSDMVEKALGGADGLKVVWARDTLGLSKDAYFQKTQTTKDLEKPWQALGHSAKSTFLLDDSPKKAHLQPWNHLCIREYLLREQKERAEIASDSVTPPEPAGKEGDEEGKARRRKEKKEKKRAEKFAALTEQDLHPVDSNGRPLEYDQTLLAVIGVLDAIKEEDNVAGWTRSGGLATLPSDWLCITVQRPADEEEKKNAQAVPLASNLWFEHEESFRNWADCGRRALAELGIEINPGITGSNG
ncbi:phosphoprotein phosphatase, partial [Coprinopsis sp. MPI-PUGE-AT-0042]